MSELEFYSEDELQQSAFAKILLTGDPKAGKTCCVLTTAPGPVVVLNCDGPGAPMAARRHGAKNLKIADITTPEQWEAGVRGAIKMASAGACRTIVVDTFTLLVNNVLALEMGKRFNGYDIWRETQDCGMNGMNALLTQQAAHVIFIAHYDINDGLINLKGSLKKDVPGIVHDRVHLEFRPGKDPSRVFHIGPSASGLSGGRSSAESKVIPADVGVLLRELGYEE